MLYILLWNPQRAIKLTIRRPYFCLYCACQEKSPIVYSGSKIRLNLSKNFIKCNISRRCFGMEQNSNENKCKSYLEHAFDSNCNSFHFLNTTKHFKCVEWKRTCRGQYTAFQTLYYIILVFVLVIFTVSVYLLWIVRSRKYNLFKWFYFCSCVCCRSSHHLRRSFPWHFIIWHLFFFIPLPTMLYKTAALVIFRALFTFGKSWFHGK